MAIVNKGAREAAKAYATAAKIQGKAQARAVKRVGVTITDVQAKAVVQRVNLKLRDAKAEIRIVSQPTADKPRLVFEVKAKGIPLLRYGARQTNTGVRVRVLKGGSTANLRAAFQLGKAGGNAFGRVGKGSKSYGSPHVGRGPIVKLFGPSILSQYIREEVQQAGIKVWNDRLPIELDRETEFALKQAGVI